MNGISNRKSITARLACLFALLLAVSAVPALGQEREVTLSGRTISIRDALREIEDKTDYLFSLGHSNFDMSNVVELADNHATVKEILDQLLEGTGRTYRMDGATQILIIPARMDKQEESRMVILPFDWSKSYKDSDFERDAREDSLRRAGGREPRTRTEVTVTADSAFTYPSRTLPLNIGRGTSWTAVSYATKSNILTIKTNLLHGALALAPNIGLETGIGPNTSIELTTGINLWNRKSSDDNNKKLIHSYLRPEFRYWLCDRFDGHFFGLNAFYWQYNVSQHEIPMMFEKEYQYEGHAFGAGVSYGYHLMLGRRWGLEFNAGVGVAFMKYDKYECARCGDLIDNYNKTYFGPTSLGIKLVYVIK